MDLPGKIKEGCGATTPIVDLKGCSFNITIVLKDNWKFETVKNADGTEKNIGSFDMYIDDVLSATNENMKKIWG